MIPKEPYLHGGEAKWCGCLVACARLVDLHHPPFEDLFLLGKHLCIPLMCPGTIGWRVASRTLGQGFKTLRCRIASRVRGWGLGPHMSNQSPHCCIFRENTALKLTQPSRDKTPGIDDPLPPNWLVTNSHYLPCQLPAESGTW